MLRQLAVALAFTALVTTTGWGEEQTSKPRFAVAIHGGAGSWPNRTAEETAEIEAGLQAALGKARDLLTTGGSSLDAVEAAIRLLEDTPCFNAGKGATFNAEGGHQLDASIMRGDDLQAGAVAAIGVAKNPISVARLVMTDTPHVLLADAGANRFAKESGVACVEPDYFWTAKTRQQWEAYRNRQSSTLDRPVHHDGPVHHYGTVGCVALDLEGNLAAGTSTGGLQGKQFGRVGDSPLIAAGTYADNRAAAVSGTGVGELFIRNAIAYDVSARMRYAGESLDKAATAQIEMLPPGTAGLIAVTQAGEPIGRFNTAAMPRGFATSAGRFEVLIDRD